MTSQPLQHRMPPHGGNGPAESRRSDQSGSSIAGGTDQLASPFGKAGCFGTMSEKKRGVVSFFTGGVGRCFSSEPRAISVEMISLCCTYRMLDLLLSIDMAHFSGRGGGRHGGSRSTWKCVCVCVLPTCQLPSSVGDRRAEELLLIQFSHDPEAKGVGPMTRCQKHIHDAELC